METNPEIPTAPPVIPDEVSQARRIKQKQVSVAIVAGLLSLIALLLLIQKSISPPSSPTDSPTPMAIPTGIWRSFVGTLLSFEYPSSWAGPSENVLIDKTIITITDGRELSLNLPTKFFLQYGQFFDSNLNRHLTIDDLKNTYFILPENIQSYKRGEQVGYLYVQSLQNGVSLTSILLAADMSATQILYLTYRNDKDRSEADTLALQHLLESLVYLEVSPTIPPQVSTPTPTLELSPTPTPWWL